MSISGISKNSVPLWAVNTDQVILADGAVRLPFIRFKNALSSEIYQCNSSVGFSSSVIKCALFTVTEQLLTGQVRTNTLSANSVISNTGNIATLNSTSAVVDNLRIPTGASNKYLIKSDASSNASWTAPAAGLSMTQYHIVGIDNETLSSGLVVTLDILCS